MRLAAHLGMTLGELQSRMSSAELSEWVAFDEEYGLPDAYFLALTLGIATLRPWTDRPIRPQDIVPYFAPPRKQQTVADHKRLFSGFARRSEVNPSP